MRRTRSNPTKDGMVKKEKKTTEGHYKDIFYESPEELMFLMWAWELKCAGYIVDIKRAESLVLSESLINDYTIVMKTKDKSASQTLLHEHVYTPEYIIEWTVDGALRFLWFLNMETKFNKTFIAQNKDDRILTYIEVKPIFDQNNMTRLFKINQKWTWDKHHIFVNLVVPQKLFDATFTPQEYLTTATGKPRKIKWEAKSLSQFLNQN